MSSIIEHNADDLFNDFLENIENEIGEPLYPGDERRIFAEALIGVLVSFLATADDQVKQSRLQYARGDMLDTIGDMYGVSRGEGTKAVTTIRFNISTPVSTDVTIPRSTAVTNDYEHYFYTTQPATIKAGETCTDVLAEASDNGSDYNNIPIGDIDVLTTTIAYVDTVYNISISSGGADEEDDDLYREKIRKSLNRFAAGTEDYYKYIAKNVDSSIADLYIGNKENKTYKLTGLTESDYYIIADDSIKRDDNALLNCKITNETTKVIYNRSFNLENGVYHITKEQSFGNSYTIEFTRTVPIAELNMYVLCHDANGYGVKPSDELILRVKEACNDDSVRCLNDKIVVYPVAVRNTIVKSITAYINPKDDVELVKKQIEESIEDYKKWQSAKINRDFNKDKLQMYIMQAGAYKVAVSDVSNEYTTKLGEVLNCMVTKINYIEQEVV